MSQQYLLFIFHQKLYVISAKVWPKRNTSWRMGRGKKKTQNKSRRSPLPLLQSVFLSGLSFPSTSTSSPLADFYFSRASAQTLSLTIKSKSRQSGGKLRKGSAEGKTKEGGEMPTFTAVFSFSPFLWFPLCMKCGGVSFSKRCSSLAFL